MIDVRELDPTCSSSALATFFTNFVNVATARAGGQSTHYSPPFDDIKTRGHTYYVRVFMSTLHDGGYDNVMYLVATFEPRDKLPSELAATNDETGPVTALFKATSIGTTWRLSPEGAVLRMPDIHPSSLSRDEWRAVEDAFSDPDE